MREQQIKNKTYREDSSLEILADKVIHDRKLGLSSLPVDIKYLLVYPHISKTVAGRCIRTSNETLFLTGKHYIIEFSGDLWDRLGEEVREILMHHELLHPDISVNKNGDYVYKNRDHNVQDFHEIISVYGIDWLYGLKTQMASVYELEPKDEDKITL